MQIKLPTSPVSQLENLWEHPFAVYGAKGIGKTTLAMSVQHMLDTHYGRGKKRVLNFRFEHGRTNLPILQVPQERKTRLTWPSAKEYADLFCDDDSFLVMVIDSLDKAYDSCFDTVCERHNIKHPKEAGRDAPSIWDQIKWEFESFFEAVLSCNRSFILLSHEKLKTEELADGTEYERYTMSAKPAAVKIAKDLCEFVLYYGYASETDKSDKENKIRRSVRTISVRNADNAVEVSCGRKDVFLQPDGKPLYRFSVPEDLGDGKLTAECLLAAYNNEVYEYGRSLEAEKRAAEAKIRLAEKRAKRRNLPSN